MKCVSDLQEALRTASPSTRREWIEIWHWQPPGYDTLVSLHTEGVD